MQHLYSFFEEYVPVPLLHIPDKDLFWDWQRVDILACMLRHVQVPVDPAVWGAQGSACADKWRTPDAPDHLRPYLHTVVSCSVYSAAFRVSSAPVRSGWVFLTLYQYHVLEDICPAKRVHEKHLKNKFAHLFDKFLAHNTTHMLRVRNTSSLLTLIKNTSLLDSLLITGTRLSFLLPFSFCFPSVLDNWDDYIGSVNILK